MRQRRKRHRKKSTSFSLPRIDDNKNFLSFQSEFLNQDAAAAAVAAAAVVVDVVDAAAAAAVDPVIVVDTIVVVVHVVFFASNLTTFPSI